MYAIIADGGRQYRVEEGQELDIDYREVATGDQIEFGRVLAVSTADGVQLGQPTLDGAKVTAEVLGVEQGERLTVQKLRRRKTFRRRTGHRQLFTRVRIDKIAGYPALCNTSGPSASCARTRCFLRRLGFFRESSPAVVACSRQVGRFPQTSIAPRS